MLDTLPDDARRLVLQKLPVETLITCERVSRILRNAVSEDVIWQSRCREFWPSCNTGSTVPSYRSCFGSANGWQHLRMLPRAVLERHSTRTLRRSSPSPEICAFDASETVVASATSSTIRLQADNLHVSWVTPGKFHDLKLVPGSSDALAIVSGSVGIGTHRFCGPTDSVGTCQVVRLSAHSLEDGVTHPSLPAPIWSNRNPGAHVVYDELLPSGPSHAYLLNTQFMDSRIARLDLSTGVVSDERGMPPWELRSACHCGEDAPHEVNFAIKRGNESILLHHDMRAPGYSGCTVCATGHANVRRVRMGVRSTVLTSHSRSKSIEQWDLRRFGSVGEAAGWQAPHGVPVDEFHCVGNAPDMHCEHGIIAAVSGGAAGTTYGAKLHIFSASPRRLSVECILPEIVIDDGHRLGCPLGIKLTGRKLTMMADRQRLLQCWVP
jgi:hypothetical protein